MNLNLKTAKTGKLLVIRVQRGTRGKKRLSAIGVVPGAEIEKLENSQKRGPILFRSKGGNTCLGNNLAEAILVEYI